MADQFVTVRLVKCNGLDLRLFQFDYDLTFAVLFLNADRTIYARYGSRGGVDADEDVSLEGLMATMRAVLDIHHNYPRIAKVLFLKQPASVTRRVPEEFASLSHFQAELDYDGQVAKSCIHCHQIRDAERLEIRAEGLPIPDQLLFAFPEPAVTGVEFDPLTRATASRVIEGSPAEAAGVRAGDEIEYFDGTPVCSQADFQWMLHQLDDDARSFNLQIRRQESVYPATVELPAGWRRKADLSWRPTTWDLRRMATGGMVLEPLDDEARDRAGVSEGLMALQATHVGQYGEHAAAKNAGLIKGDIVVSFAGRDDLLTESACIDHALRQMSPGDEAEIVYLRNGERRTAVIKLK